MDEFLGMDEFLAEMDESEVELSDADEAAILLDAIEAECTPEEWQKVLENLHELEIYGLIPSAEIATEAKKVVYKQTKQMNLNREQSKAALRIAERKNTAAWKQYRKHRDAMIEARNQIFKQHLAESKKVAKNVLKNGRKKASSMKNQTVTGEMLVNKIGARQNKVNNGKSA